MSFPRGSAPKGRDSGNTAAKRPITAGTCLNYGAQLADALEKAHRSGVVHRHLKPRNIMLTLTGAKLLDSGLAKPAAATLGNAAKVAAALPNSTVTAEGAIVSTFQYMSPEQVEGKEVGVRSDIFSLGAVLMNSRGLTLAKSLCPLQFTAAANHPMQRCFSR